MSETATLPTPGQIARVRQRTYLVEQVVKPKRVADSTLRSGPVTQPRTCLIVRTC